MVSVTASPPGPTQTQPTSQGVKRKRKSHPKTRTGCFTCKIRRKKCGEEKPACLRCTSTGRKCDGYPIPKTEGVGLITPPTSPGWTGIVEDTGSNERELVLGVGERQWEWAFTPSVPTSASSAPSSFPPFTNLLLPNPSPTAFSPFTSPLDTLAYDFFLHSTSPLFTNYFETTLWTGPMLRAALTSPAVHAAVIALGAVHRRHDLGITPEAFVWCDFVAKAHARALALRSREEAGLGVEMSLILSWLLATFEVFQGNEQMAARHLQRGLTAFFRQDFKPVQERSMRQSIPLNEKSIRSLFDKLQARALAIFDGPAFISPPTGCSKNAALPECPSHFYSLEHARDVLFTQIHWIFDELARGDKDERGRLRGQQAHVERLLQWSGLYACLCRTEGATQKSKSSHRAAASCVLRVCRELTYLLLLLRPEVRHPSLYEFLNPSVMEVTAPHAYQNPSSNPAMNAHFAKLTFLANRILNWDPKSFETSLTRPSFGVDSGVNFPSSFPCNIPHWRKLRHQTVKMAQDATHDVWDKLGAWSIAEKTSMIEVEAARTCGALKGVTRLPEGQEARWLDVTCYMGERRVLRSYCVSEDGGLEVKGIGGLVWVQEWITF